MSRRAYYEGLPIYKAATDTAVALHEAVRGFARFHKYTLGAELQRQSILIVQLVAAANRRSERAGAADGSSRDSPGPGGARSWRDSPAVGNRGSVCETRLRGFPRAHGPGQDDGGVV